MYRLSLTVISSILFLSACGGSGGDEAADAPSYYNGTYTGNLVKTVDNCFIGVERVAVTHIMRVEGPEVVVNVNSLTLRGTPHGEGAVNVTYEVTSNGVTTTAENRYGTPMGSELGSAFNVTSSVVGRHNQTGVSCQLVYAGTVRKQ